MATSLVINGVSYLYPDTGDQSWGTVASAWASAVTTGMLQKAGGSFTLTADVNFGPNFGLLSKYLTSITAAAAASGFIRLATTDAVSWRNNANSADILLAKNASDQLTWGGNAFLSNLGIVPITAGGTGQATQTASFNALQPGTTKGDLIVYNGINGVRLPAGSDGQILSALAASSTGLTWVSPLTNPMTTLGDIIVGGSAGAATRLAGDISNTRKFLRSLSSGGVSGSPVWDQILAGDVPTLNQNTTGTASNVTGIVLLANGGTGASTQAGAANAVLPSQASNSGMFLTSDGTNVSWATVTTPAKTVSTKSANYTLSTSDDLILGDATSAAFTLTVPSASSSRGKLFRIKKIDSSTNAVTIARTGTDTFDGATSITLSAQYQEIALISNGTNWYRVELSSPRSEVSCDTGNGFGSTNTGVRRYTNSSTTGLAVTYADSATLGGTFTINEDGIYTLYQAETGATADYAGITKNCSLGTTSISTITPAQGKLICGAFANGLISAVSVTLALKANDVIRFQGSTTVGNYTSGSSNTLVRITKVSN